MNPNLIIYQTEDGVIKIQTRLENETVWLSQEQMSDLFQKARSTINEHIKNIFSEKELEEPSTTTKFRIYYKTYKLLQFRYDHFSRLQSQIGTR